MKSLELKIPPVVVAAIMGGFQWLATRFVPVMSVEVLSRIDIALVFGISGALVIFTGVWQFKRSATTVNPHKPQNSSKLVSSGIYKWTRNPMYLGMSLLLLGWGVYLANALSIGLVWIFIAFLTRFQIIPEEKYLEQLFPDEFEPYCERTRRWI